MDADALYVLGAFEARGSVGIQRQEAGKDRLIGRLSVDTVTESDRLREFFACEPQALRAYKRQVFRYGSADPGVVLVCIKKLMSAMPEIPRLNELLILQRFHLATSIDERVKAMDALRRSRVGLGEVQARE